MKLFRKILIANRGEIAVRIMQSAHKLGIQTVAIYSRADEDSLAVRTANEAYLLDGTELSDTYLDIDKIVKIAQESGCDAIHPGYGFLAENTHFAKACTTSNITFIGPHSDAILLMGNKVEARKFVEKLKVPLTRAATGNFDELVKASSEIPYPILVKAASGGGGKGMRIVHTKEELPNALTSTSREALSYFGDAEVFIEQYIENPRHIEIQVLGDKHGNYVHLYERECSIQRRYQKIIEESPSPTLTQEVREAMGKTAIEITKAVNYDNAGTIEFLLDSNMNYYFLEMNTRIQVEHPVTEMVTNVDLVSEQIRIAAGNPLNFKQEDIKQVGHAIEARIYAEKPEEDFRPAPGDICYYHQANGEGIRIDSAIDQASTIHSFYDPMISKVITYGEDRDVAKERLLHALKDTSIIGIDTNNEFLVGMLESEAFGKNEISTKFCDLRSEEIFSQSKIQKDTIQKEFLVAAYALFDLNQKNQENATSVWSQIGFWRHFSEITYTIDETEYRLEILDKTDQGYTFNINGTHIKAQLKDCCQHRFRAIINGQSHRYHVASDKNGKHFIQQQAFVFEISRRDELIETDFFEAFEGSDSGDAVFAPMPGKLIQINVKVGDQVVKGDVLLIVEAMKMENNVLAGRDGEIAEINFAEGEMVDPAKALIKLKELLE